MCTSGDSLPELAYDVTATTVVLGALASRDWRPMHHDHDFAVNRNGTQRHLHEHAEPGGVVRALPHRLDGAEGPARAHAVPHEGLGVPGRHDGARAARSTTVETDDTGCGWATLLVRLTVDGDLKTDCTARIALPTGDDDNPWTRRGDQWRPETQEHELMDLDFTDEQEMLREMVRGVCSVVRARSTTVRALEDDPVGYPAELWKQLAELDLIGLMIAGGVRRVGDERCSKAPSSTRSSAARSRRRRTS